MNMYCYSAESNTRWYLRFIESIYSPIKGLEARGFGGPVLNKMKSEKRRFLVAPPGPLVAFFVAVYIQSTLKE